MLGILEASTEYILGKARTLGISSEAIENPSSTSESDEEEDRATNPWNVYVREETIGGSVWQSTKVLSASYKQIGDERRANLKRKCEAADELDVTKKKFRSRFGPDTREQGRFIKHQLVQGRLADLRTRADSFRVGA